MVCVFKYLYLVSPKTGSGKIIKKQPAFSGLFFYDCFFKQILEKMSYFIVPQK